ncbi:MAG TPA: arginine repressor [Thermoanaerobaculia bacterium]|nr:arginine repressor [Thermoanaerobaculia bacterium]
MNFHSHGDATRRREEILLIVGQTAVHSQDELLVALRERGFSVTQPTLSRDLRELGLVKTQNGYVSPESLAPLAPVAAFAPRQSLENRFEQLVRSSVLFAEAAGNMVVVKTPVAAAQPVASAIDALPIEDALGTIGGDDTIFIAFRTPAAAIAFTRRVHQIAGIRPPVRRTRA